MFRKIVVPLDGSKVAERAMAYAKFLANKDQATIHLIRVSSTELVVGSLGGYPVPQAIIETQIQIHRDYLSRLKAGLEEQGFLVQTHIPQGDASSAILSLAEREQCDLIVMTSHGRSGVSRFLLGSVAERLSRHAVCPVLIVGRESLKAHEELGS